MNATATATDKEQRIRELQAVLLDPTTDRPTWMAAHRMVQRIYREEHLRRSVAAATASLEGLPGRPRHADHGRLRRRLAADLAELAVLERQL